MFRWFRALSSGAALLLVSRWLLGVRPPSDDLEAVRKVAAQISRAVCNAWAIFWRMYGPVTADMRAKWEKLRSQYRDGSYGIEGT